MKDGALPQGREGELQLYETAGEAMGERANCQVTCSAWGLALVRAPLASTS